MDLTHGVGGVVIADLVDILVDLHILWDQGVFGLDGDLIAVGIRGIGAAGDGHEEGADSTGGQGILPLGHDIDAIIAGAEMDAGTAVGIGGDGGEGESADVPVDVLVGGGGEILPSVELRDTGTQDHLAPDIFLHRADMVKIKEDVLKPDAVGSFADVQDTVIGVDLRMDGKGVCGVADQGLGLAALAHSVKQIHIRQRLDAVDGQGDLPAGCIGGDVFDDQGVFMRAVLKLRCGEAGARHGRQGQPVARIQSHIHCRGGGQTVGSIRLLRQLRVPLEEGTAGSHGSGGGGRGEVHQILEDLFRVLLDQGFVFSGCVARCDLGIAFVKVFGDTVAAPLEVEAAAEVGDGHLAAVGGVPDGQLGGSHSLTHGQTIHPGGCAKVFKRGVGEAV